jgi:hypothetical protein
MSKLNESSEEVKKLAIEKIAHVKIYQIQLIVDIIDLASSRGAFKGVELSNIGTIYDSLVGGINESIRLANEDLNKVDPQKMTIEEIKE